MHAALCAEFNEIKNGKYSLYIDPDRIYQMEEFKTNRRSIYLNLEKDMPIENYEDLFGLDIALLRIRFLPLDSFIVYLAFPDGGKMLILLDDKVNPRGLRAAIEKLLIKKKREAFLMKIVGWKPRIDWLVITSLLTRKDEIVKILIDKFNVKQIITPTGFNYSLPPEVKHKKLKPDEQIDLMQAASPVKMTSYGTDKLNEKSLILKLSYTDFSFLFLPGISRSEESAMIKKYSKNLKSTVIIFNRTFKSLSKNFLSVTEPGLIIPKDVQIRLSTGGHLLYITEENKKNE